MPDSPLLICKWKATDLNLPLVRSILIVEILVYVFYSFEKIIIRLLNR